MEIKLETYKNIYFLGIGGIGMSALARYFHTQGYQIAGYDKTPSPLTDQLLAEGIPVHFEDWGPSIPKPFSDVAETLVIYTPAIPKNLGEFLHVQHKNYTLLKRAQVLGIITKNSRGIGVAGTHGKTTTSTLLAHILNESELKCSAFLGGISNNFGSNYVGSNTSDLTVIEADEFDRSFLNLHPFSAIITSTDADHLDIYGDAAHVLEGFQLFAQQIDSKGILLLKKGLDIPFQGLTKEYAIDEVADYSGSALRMTAGKFFMDVLINGNETWSDVELGLPGIHNAENALACIGIAQFLGLQEAEIRKGLKTFTGIKRRFEYQLRTEELIYIDDYAHHPTEIAALIRSIRLLYPKLPITGIFQPHLFSRTRDFMADFAKELSQLDHLLLFHIYPAREEPISGVNSEALLKLCQNETKALCTKESLLNQLQNVQTGVILTIGAGDIDRLVPSVKLQLLQNIQTNSL